MGYNISNSLHVKGSLLTLEVALKNRNYRNEPDIHHSDRGLQYCSNEYQKVLEKNDIQPSMTEQYDPYENAIKIYNDYRPHLSNYMLTPNQMHKQNIIKRKQYKMKKR